MLNFHDARERMHILHEQNWEIIGHQTVNYYLNKETVCYLFILIIYKLKFLCCILRSWAQFLCVKYNEWRKEKVKWCCLQKASKIKSATRGRIKSEITETW